MIEKDKLKEYAKKLMFDMNEEEYETLQKEFDVILRQMDIIDKIPNLHEVEPMTFPFLLKDRSLRDDELIAVCIFIGIDPRLLNSPESLNSMDFADEPKEGR